MTYKSALLGAVSFSLALPVFAQANANADTIIVQGSRLNQTATEVGSSVSIITSDDIEQLGFDFALDALAAAPGVTINSNGAFGGVATVRIRGAASEQTLVLVDGVPVTDPSSVGGGFNFARFDTENIDRIEVLKGPQSTLWGTDAIGGVVSITTERAGEGLGGSIFGEYGSFNTFRGGASVENGNDNGDFRLAVVGTSSDGISKADEDDGNTEDDAYESLTLSANGGFNLRADARLSADILWTDSESEFDNSGGPGGDGDRVSETEELSANAKLTASLFDGRLDNLLLVGYSEIDRANSGADAFPLDTGGERVLYRYQGTLAVNDANKFAFGFEREETSVDDDDTYINGYFALYEFKPLDKLTLTGGVRVDDHEAFGTETTGRFAAAYNPTDALTLRASWGEGFKAPTLFQTTFFCCGATEPNRDLQPETSEAFDIGIDWRSTDGRAEAGVTYFDQDAENQIDFSFALGGYLNIEEVQSQGVEIYGTYQLTDWLSISADYAFIDSQDGAGDATVRVPEHSGDIRLSFDPDGPVSGTVLIRHNGEEQEDTNFDGVPDAAVDSWTRVDIAASYDVNDQVELFGRVENVLDEDYQQVLGYGTPDLSGYVGVRLRY